MLQRRGTKGEVRLVVAWEIVSVVARLEGAGSRGQRPGVRKRQREIDRSKERLIKLKAKAREREKER